MDDKQSQTSGPEPAMAIQTTLHWWIRASCLLVGVLLAMVALNQFAAVGVAPDELALGKHTLSLPVNYQGRQINVWRIGEFSDIYPSKDEPASASDGLWLGNSQLHSINEAVESDATAPYYASEILNRPVYGLSLANADIQEHLVVFQWALSRRQCDTLVLPLVYDDLREDGLRDDFKEIADEGLMGKLRAYPVGARLADELDAMKQESSDVQGTSHADRSLQDRSEVWLTDALSSSWHIWDERPEIYGAIFNGLYKLRNWVFRIDPTSKRKMIPLRFDKNMAALKEIFRVAKDAQVTMIVYIVPVRWNPEPPYQIDRYRQWKQEVAGLCDQAGVTFADLDAVVPEEDWGYLGEMLDFMHFKDQGHRVLGQEVARLIRQAHSRTDTSP